MLYGKWIFNQPETPEFQTFIREHAHRSTYSSDIIYNSHIISPQAADFVVLLMITGGQVYSLKSVHTKTNCLTVIFSVLLLGRSFSIVFSTSSSHIQETFAVCKYLLQALDLRRYIHTKNC